MILKAGSDSEKANIIYDSSKESVTGFCIPAAITGTLLLCFSYIIDILFAGAAEIGVGETSVVAKTLFDTAGLVNKLIFPLVSAGIAVFIGGSAALTAGLCGGLIAGMGSTFANANANATGISGVAGAAAAGFVAGYCVKYLRKSYEKTKGVKVKLPHCALSIVSIISAVLSVFFINTIASYLNHYAAILLGATNNVSSILLAVILGVFMTCDYGGPLYLAGYVFGVASISSGQPEVMAAVVAAGAIPTLSIGLYSILYSDKFTRSEKLAAYTGIAGGLLGVPQCAVPFYITLNYRYILACIPGGCISAILSVLFRCYTNLPAGGILSFSMEGRPEFFLLALTCGVLTSTFLISLTDRRSERTETGENKPIIAERVTA